MCLCGTVYLGVWFLYQKHHHRTPIKDKMWGVFHKSYSFQLLMPFSSIYSRMSIRVLIMSQTHKCLWSRFYNLTLVWDFQLCLLLAWGKDEAWFISNQNRGSSARLNICSFARKTRNPLWVVCSRLVLQSKRVMGFSITHCEHASIIVLTLGDRKKNLNFADSFT